MKKDQNCDVDVAVLDDDVLSAKLTKETLIHIGIFKVKSYSNALPLLRGIDEAEIKPNIILCDLDMPGLDGIKFMQELGKRCYGGIVIPMSGKSEEILISSTKICRSYNLLTPGYIEKPATIKALAALINKISYLARCGYENYNPYQRSDLECALLRREFICHYQPQVDISTGGIYGYEALARWNHPSDGLIFPGGFIKNLEKFSLINEFTLQSLIPNTFQQLRRWNDADSGLKMSINISPQVLDGYEFSDFMIDQACKYGINSENIIIEITENEQTDKTSILESVTRLRLRGFNLSLDDFGMGYSSISRLNCNPYNKLKVDKSLVHNAWKDKRLQAMFESSVDVANKLKLEIIAEGIEDFNDWIYVKKSTCKIAQGYFIGKALPCSLLCEWETYWRDKHKRLGRL